MAIVYTPKGRCMTTEVWPIYWPLIRTDARASPVCISTVCPCNGRAGTGLGVSQVVVGTRGAGCAASRGGGSGDFGSAVVSPDTSVRGRRGIRGGVASGVPEACPLNCMFVASYGLGAIPRGGASCKSCACLCGLGAERSTAPGVSSAMGAESLDMTEGAVGSRRASGCEGLWGCALSVLVRRVVPGGGGDGWSVSRGVADAAPGESGLESNAVAMRRLALAVE